MSSSRRFIFRPNTEILASIEVLIEDGLGFANLALVVGERGNPKGDELKVSRRWLEKRSLWEGAISCLGT
jgi:hypothetical protein